MSIPFVIIGSLAGLLLLGFGAVSIGERETRAATIAITAGLVLLALWFGFGLILPQWTLPAAVGLAAAAALAALLLLYPMGENSMPALDEQKAGRVDEREIMFARARLKEGTAEFQTFYGSLRPDLAEVDNELRRMPRLGAPGGRYYVEQDSAYFDALFDYIEEIHHLGDFATPQRPEPLEISAAEATRRVKAFARHLGALEVGVTSLKDHHLYSHVGRGQGAWGEPVTLAHRFVIVFTVEMEQELIRNAPMMPAIAESATQYLRGAMIAASLAGYCSRLGYPARAHVDGNYRVLATAAAVDAGLGEIGRLGLLITPTHGPRVRLAAVTTDLPLVADQPRPFGAQEFCRICLKCAHCCPGRAIPEGGREEVRGLLKWQSSQEDCYRYWLRAGSDCGLCIAVCPYSKPATIFHNLVRQACAANPLARWLAHRLDNFFYGRRPRHTDVPHWFKSG
jgi:hypothetical protein